MALNTGSLLVRTASGWIWCGFRSARVSVDGESWVSAGPGYPTPTGLSGYSYSYLWFARARGDTAIVSNAHYGSRGALLAGGIVITRNSGSTWSPLSAPWLTVDAQIYPHPVGWLAVASDGFYVSADDAATWAKVWTRGTAGAGLPAAQDYRVEARGDAEGAFVYTYSPEGLYRSTDLTTWALVVDGTLPGVTLGLPTGSQAAQRRPIIPWTIRSGAGGGHGGFTPAGAGDSGSRFWG